MTDIANLKINLSVQNILEEFGKQNNVEIVALPLNNFERRKKLRSLLQDNTRSQISDIISEEVNKYKDQLIAKDLEIPRSFSMEYEWEYNDEGGTDPYLRYLTFYDAEGNMIDLYEEITVSHTYSNGKTETYAEDLHGYLKESIRNNFNSRILENEVGEDKISLNII